MINSWLDQRYVELEALRLQGLNVLNGGEPVIFAGDVNPVVLVILVCDHEFLWWVGLLNVLFLVHFGDHLFDLSDKGQEVLWEDSLSFDYSFVYQLEGW